MVKTRSGRTLSEDDIERLAAEVEKGLDLSGWKTRRGRPPLDAATGEHAPRIAVRVPADVHRRVVARAAREGRSMSEVVRDLLEGYAREAVIPKS
jgi:predicted HicB family RNase H-like nuclease